MAGFRAAKEFWPGIVTDAERDEVGALAPCRCSDLGGADVTCSHGHLGRCDYAGAGGAEGGATLTGWRLGDRHHGQLFVCAPVSMCILYIMHVLVHCRPL
jgi:hypothetical protein